MELVDVAAGLAISGAALVLCLVIGLAIDGAEIVGEGNPDGHTPYFEMTFSDGTTHKVVYYEHLKHPLDKPRYYKMLVWTPDGTQWMEYNQLNVVTVQKLI